MWTPKNLLNIKCFFNISKSVRSEYKFMIIYIILVVLLLLYKNKSITYRFLNI